MRMSDGWVSSQINQNAILKTANMQVVNQFGTMAPPAGSSRTKSKEDNKFVVGETKVGGEETI